MPQETWQSWKPTPRELWNKITEARRLLKEGKWRPADAVKLQEDLYELEAKFNVDVATFEDRTKILIAVAEEVTPNDYSGKHPPEPAYQEDIKGELLFAFCWKSSFFSGAQMYFKFALKGAEKGRRVCPCSIHESRS